MSPVDWPVKIHLIYPWGIEWLKMIMEEELAMRRN